MLLYRYQREFGFVIAARDIIVDDVRVRGIGKSHVDVDHVIPTCTGPPTPVLVKYIYKVSLFDEQKKN